MGGQKNVPCALRKMRQFVMQISYVHPTDSYVDLPMWSHSLYVRVTGGAEQKKEPHKGGSLYLRKCQLLHFAFLDSSLSSS